MTLSPSHTPLHTLTAAFPLTQTPSQAELRELFDYDPEGFLCWKQARGNKAKGSKAGYLNHHGYLVIKLAKRGFQAHRLIYCWHRGVYPDEVDHINRDRSDNRIENLRPATASENRCNSVRKTAFGFKGITLTPYGTFHTTIQHQGQVHRKTFKTLAQAQEHINQLRQTLHGQFANSR